MPPFPFLKRVDGLRPLAVLGGSGTPGIPFLTARIKMMGHNVVLDFLPCSSVNTAATSIDTPVLRVRKIAFASFAGFGVQRKLVVPLARGFLMIHGLPCAPVRLSSFEPDAEGEVLSAGGLFPSAPLILRVPLSVLVKVSSESGRPNVVRCLRYNVSVYQAAGSAFSCARMVQPDRKPQGVLVRITRSRARISFPAF